MLDRTQRRMAIILKPENVAQLVFFIRGEKVMFDADLAMLYGVTTKALNQAVKRNSQRFPSDFMFQLTKTEHDNMRSQIVTSSEDKKLLRSQFATSSSQEAESEEGVSNRSQIATGFQKHRDPRLRPYAFTQHGALQGQHPQ